MPVEIEELEPTTRNDYRRANGAPMVNINGKNERFSRPSSFAKPLDDESALVNWKIDRACIGVAHDRALQARWVALADDDREAKSKAREDAIAAGRGAERADIGTALHAMSVRWEQEPNFNPPEPYFSSLTSYENELKRLGLETIRFEFHTVNVEYRCAGTADRLYELTRPLVTPTGAVLPVGTLLVGDLKTGEKLEYSKAAYSVQLALYADGEFYDVLADELMPTPPINREWGIIVHMPADQPGLCEFLWCDLDVGRHGAYLVQQIKLWRRNWRSDEFSLPPIDSDDQLLPPAEVEPCWCGDPLDTAVTHQTAAPCFVVPASVLDAPITESTKPPSVEGDGGASLDGYIEWIKERVAQIASNETAKRRLMYLWPGDLPVPKRMTSMNHVDAALPLLDTIEAEYQLSFVPRPASIQTTGPATHKGKGK